MFNYQFLERFSQDPLNVLKIIEEVCREPLSEMQLEKNGSKIKLKGGKVFIEPLGGVENFQGSVENPLRVLGTGEGCFKTLQDYCENILAGSA
jgi:hypothetical protein